MRWLIVIMVLAMVLIAGCTQQITKQTETEFKLPDSFITMQGFITAVKSGGCNQGRLSSQDIITSGDCASLNNQAPCIRIPLSLLDYYWEGGRENFFIDNLTCGGERGKPYCQIKMDNNVIIQGCFETDLKAIPTYSEKPIDISMSHSFSVCCSATDSKSGWDTCKSFTLDKVC